MTRHDHTLVKMRTAEGILYAKRDTRPAPMDNDTTERVVTVLVGGQLAIRVGFDVIPCTFDTRHAPVQHTCCGESLAQRIVVGYMHAVVARVYTYCFNIRA